MSHPRGLAPGRRGPAAVLAEQLVTSYEFFDQQLKTEVERRF
ncbi:MAG: hypothetical protein OXH86_12940 [Acidimicrobiaceae bacterium]|nr:hypothetical protein [Acidimicrobiaceae bacterium]